MTTYSTLESGSITVDEYDSDLWAKVTTHRDGDVYTGPDGRFWLFEKRDPASMGKPYDHDVWDRSTVVDIIGPAWHRNHELTTVATLRRATPLGSEVLDVYVRHKNPGPKNAA